MKRVLLATIIAALAFSLPALAKNEKKTVQLDRKTFLEKVVDYENQKEWKYLGDKPAIIDFYTDWCGYCKKLAPTLEELASEYEGKIIIYKVDAMKERELAAAFRVAAFPTLVFIPEEGYPQIAEGALPKEDLKKLIDGFLLKTNNN